MKKPRKAERPFGRDMSRGEFLAAGATAAVGGVVGGTAGKNEEFVWPPGMRLLPQDACGGSCTDVPPVWAIRAGVLNALWNDVMPRVAADAWLNHEELSEAINNTSDPVQEFLQRMRRFFHMAPLGTYTYPPPPPPSSPTHELSALRAARFLAVDDYLSSTDPGRIPIRWPSPGGYDFLLSDKGLEIFVPERPSDERELLRYYTFRGTGRRAIGTPLYLEHALSATSTETATGPGEIIFRPEILLQVVRAEVGTSPPAACAELINCLQIKTGIPFSQGWQMRRDDLTAWGDRQIVNLSHLRRPEGLRGQEKRQGLALTMAQYMCIMSGFRCWQMEGATYRGIMTEFPRVAALVWLEEYDNVSNAESYRNRIDLPERAREVFAERLETMIDHQMSFMPYDPAVYMPPSSSPWYSRWSDPAEPDVMVTNQGIQFPQVDSWSSRFGANPLETMLSEIAAGRAGNPVFTDSMRTGGGEE